MPEESGPCRIRFVGEPDLVLLQGGWEASVVVTDRGRDDCPHESTVNGVIGGPESVLCEECGDVVARDETMNSREIDRSMFFRKADRVESQSS